MAICAVVYMGRFSDYIVPEVNCALVAIFVATVASLAGAMAGPATLPADVDTPTRLSARAHKCGVTGVVVVGYDHPLSAR